MREIGSLAWLLAIFAILVNQMALPLHAGGSHARPALSSGNSTHDGHSVAPGSRETPGDATPGHDGQGGCHFCRLAQAILPVPQFALIALVGTSEPAWQQPSRSVPSFGILRQGHSPRAPPSLV